MMRIVVAGVFAASLMPFATFAALQRTFVASNGNDANPCSLVQPCRGFSAATTKTNPGGEIVVLDSAGYGPVTITKSISILAPAGIYAGITVSAGDGVTVDGSGIAVVLRGLSINGQGGANGVRFVQGASLTIEDCVISNFQIASLSSISGVGIYTRAPDSRTVIKNTTVRDTLTGAFANSFSGIIRVTMTDSTLSNNQTGALADSNTGSEVQFTVTHSVVMNSGFAFDVINDVSNSSFFLNDNTVTFSDVAFRLNNVAGQAIFTSGNNAVGYFGTSISGGGSLSVCCAM